MGSTTHGLHAAPIWATARLRDRLTPGVVKQDKSSGGSVDMTKPRSDPQRVMSRPMGAAKRQTNQHHGLVPPPLLDLALVPPPCPALPWYWPSQRPSGTSAMAGPGKRADIPVPQGHTPTDPSRTQRQLICRTGKTALCHTGALNVTLSPGDRARATPSVRMAKRSKASALRHSECSHFALAGVHILPASPLTPCSLSPILGPIPPSLQTFFRPILVPNLHTLRAPLEPPSCSSTGLPTRETNMAPDPDSHLHRAASTRTATAS